MIFPIKFRAGWPEKIGLALMLTTVALVLAYTNGLYRWDWLFYDWNLAAWSRPPADDIVIIAIDEQSLREVGRWPWSRRIHAELIRKLTVAGAKAIALDIVFAEPDAADPAADAKLATALAENGRVVLPVLNEQSRGGGQLLETLPIPALAAAVAGMGHVDVELDRDNTVRSVYLKAGLGSPYWSALALALVELTHRQSGQTTLLPGQRAASSDPPSPYAWQRDYRILIPFAGPPGHFQQVSYSEVLRGNFPPATFRDKFVLVGLTASGIGNTLLTPVSGLARPMPGVEYNANILDALRHGLAIQPLSAPGSLLLTGLLVLLPMVLYGFCPPRWMLPLAGLALLLTLASSFVLLHGAHLWFPPTTALLVQSLSYPLWSWRRLQQAIRLLFAEQQRAQVTLNTINDAVITMNAEGIVESLNAVAEALIGGAATARGQPMGAIFQVANDQGGYADVDLVALCLEKNQPIQLPDSTILVTPTGQRYAIRASATPVRDQKGQVSGVIVSLSNLTEMRRLTEQMAYQATHDELTHLPNVNLLCDQLKDAIARAQRASQSLALLLVDLDHFKTVNDGLGHTVDDALLEVIAARLRSFWSTDDAIARAGGNQLGAVAIRLWSFRREENTATETDDDEFLFTIKNLCQTDSVTNFAQQLLEALSFPVQVANHEYVITANIGVSVFAKDGEDAETLLKNAGIAMRRAKRNGHDNIQPYTHDMHTRSLKRLMMEQDLRSALKRQELELHYQPQMNLRESRIIGVEALVRWRHPQHGLLLPLTFVPLAEETGLIESIDEWVLKTACQQAKTWQREGLPTLRMAVNLSPCQFLQPGMTHKIARILQEIDLEPQHLDLEITESLLMKDVESSIMTMHAIKAIGVRLSIDDFGMSYSFLSYLKQFPLSSMDYLKQFPVDQLKIDKSLLHEMVISQEDTDITQAIITMAHSMLLTVIAKGVENKMQQVFLKANQCDEIQGYYLSRPVPPHQVPALLKSGRAAST